MARIKIEDIQKDRRLGKELMKKIRGGLLINDETTLPEDDISNDLDIGSDSIARKRPGRVKYS